MRIDRYNHPIYIGCGCIYLTSMLLGSEEVDTDGCPYLILRRYFTPARVPLRGYGILQIKPAASIAVHYIRIFVFDAEQNKVCNLHVTESLGDQTLSLEINK